MAERSENESIKRGEDARTPVCMAFTQNGESPGSTFILNIHYTTLHPVAVPDAYDVLEDTILNIDIAEGVLANDVNPMVGVLEARLISNPHNGVLTLSSEGDFNYVPNPGFVGEDSFWYKTHDGMNKSNMTKVSIVVYSP